MNQAANGRIKEQASLEERRIHTMSNSTPASEVVDVLGISVRLDFTMREIVRELVRRAEKRIRTDVAFLHTDCVNIAQVDQEYAEVLERQDFVLPDGVGVKIGAMFKGQRPRDNINGTDMFPVLCDAVSKHNQSVFFLGAKPGVAERMREKLAVKFPQFRVAGIQHGYFEVENTKEIIDQINASGADFLMVGFGAPLQEKWLQDHGDEIDVPIRMGVGGLFDFLSGDIPRAPLWMRKNGLEWLFRFLIQPRLRFKRYVIGSPLFIGRLLVERLKLK